MGGLWSRTLHIEGRDIEILQQIAEGGFASVFLCTDGVSDNVTILSRVAHLCRALEYTFV